MKMSKIDAASSGVAEDNATISNEYGYYDRASLEYVINRADTPHPWVNYITNGRYSGLVTNAGGGYSFYISPKDSRITRWRYNCLPMDRPGRYIYLRDRETGKFRSLTWQPTPAFPITFYECRHGMNYTKITTEADGIRSEVTYFAAKDDLEIWRVRLFETRGRARTLDIYSYAEMCLGHALVDLINQPNDKHFNDVHFLPGDEIIMASKRYWVTFNSATVKQANKAWDKWVFMASSLPVEGFDGSKDEFIGKWRSEENPQAVEQGVSFDTRITAGDAVCSLRSPVLLDASGSLEFHYMMGVVPKTGDDPEHTREAEEEAVKMVEKYRDPDRIEKEFQAILDARDDYLSGMQIEIPDQEMQDFINFWNQYQSKTTFQFSRDASYHHGGLLFGRGYRDSCQDAMGPLLTKPGWVRERILEMSRRQFNAGNVYHCYYPLSGGGEITGHSDTPLWLPLIIMKYLEETGDFGILEEVEEYADEGKGTILEHFTGALDFLKSRMNDQGLVYIGPGDWNDTLDYCGREGKGVSAMNTFIYAWILKEAVHLLNRLEHPAAAEYDKLYHHIKKACNEHLWDGQWYIRAINDKGEKVGSSENTEGKIFLNAQSWAVISGVAEGERAITCMASAMEHCDTPKGPKILDPSYTRVDENIGLATRCVPGKKENGAVFNHALSWSYLAMLLLKNSDQAYSIYKKALPSNPVVNPDRYEMEPYVYSEYVTGPDHPTFGQASHSWLTGSSVWMLRNTTDYFLGIKPVYDGLMIDPCIPENWESFRVIRKFRGAIYEIDFEIENGGKGDVISIELDGKSIEGNVIPPLSDGKTHVVKVKIS